MATESLSEQVAALENALAAAERQASAQRQRAETAERNEAILRLRVKAAESALAQARVAGAREALTRLRDSWRRDVWLGNVGENIERFRDREYPATGEEPKCAVCKGAREVFDPVNHVWTWCRECQSHPPQAVTEPTRAVPLKVIAAFISPINSSRWQGGLVNVTEDGAWWHYADAAGEWQRIAGPLASRPTASGEG